MVLTLDTLSCREDHLCQTRAPHAGANARLLLLLEIHWACLITSNSTTYIRLNGSTIIMSGFGMTHFEKTIK